MSVVRQSVSQPLAYRTGVTGDVASQVAPQGRRRAEAVSRFSINGRFYGQAVTGVQRYAREIVRVMDGALARRDERARLLTCGTVDDLPAFEAIETVRLPPFEGHLWEQATLAARAPGPLLNLCNAAPVLHRRQIVCLHDANVFTVPESYGAGFRAVYRTLHPVLARRAAHVTSVSAFSASQLAAHLGLRASDVTVLPNGHEHAYRWDASASRLFQGASQPERPYILMLGSRARHKNVGLLLGLADALDTRGLDLYVAGRCANVFAAMRTDQPRNVRWLGAVTDDDLALLYAGALCLAFPSLTEGFGLPLVEAMALGCPVVSSNRASMPEVCGRAALLADPDDPTQWMAHFAALLDSGALAAELRERGRAQAKRFSWTTSAEGYLELLRRMT